MAAASSASAWPGVSRVAACRASPPGGESRGWVAVYAPGLQRSSARLRDQQRTRRRRVALPALDDMGIDHRDAGILPPDGITIVERGNEAACSAAQVTNDTLADEGLVALPGAPRIKFRASRADRFPARCVA